VSSFDIGDHVYFFFRELSLEHATCGRVTYSRVARVCKVHATVMIDIDPGAVLRGGHGGHGPLTVRTVAPVPPP